MTEEPNTSLNKTTGGLE